MILEVMMNGVPSVGPIRPQSVFPFETDAQQKGPATFSEMLKSAVKSVDALEKNADEMMLKLATGDVKDVHEVIMAAEKAEMALQLTVEIRDRIIEAYQQIMRMAV
ncbi:MAG: flagellar hook-basal body complex protein FliE [bacterium]